MEHRKTWSRRKFSKAAVSAQLLLSSGFLTIGSGCSSSDTENGELLNSEHLNVLKTAMDEIIPASEQMPSASSVGGVDYVVSVLKDYPDLIAPLRRILEDLNHTNDHSFTDLDGHRRIEALNEFENAHPERFSVLQNFTYESYYINETIWKLIGYKPYPTLTAGPKMEPFDPSLLERVKDLPQLYIDPES